MDAKFGIENLKKLVKFSCDLTKQMADSLKDGWQWTDAFLFINEASQIPGVVKSLPAIKQELAELSTVERTELNEFFAAEFDLANDKVELFIEHSLSVAISLIALVEEWKLKNAA